MKRLITTTAMFLLLAGAALADNHNNALGGAKPGGTGHTNEGYGGYLSREVAPGIREFAPYDTRRFTARGRSKGEVNNAIAGGRNRAESAKGGLSARQ